MRYISTRGNGSPVSSADVIIRGLAPGGGLFVPESMPAADLRSLAGASYHMTARKVLVPLLSDFQMKNRSLHTESL
jgi:threonine synthase